LATLAYGFHSFEIVQRLSKTWMPAVAFGRQFETIWCQAKRSGNEEQKTPKNTSQQAAEWKVQDMFHRSGSLCSIL
jgi:hypothetical protein